MLIEHKVVPLLVYACVTDKKVRFQRLAEPSSTAMLNLRPFDVWRPFELVNVAF